jgi:transcription initiation factor TFIID/TFIIF subunit
VRLIVNSGEPSQVEGYPMRAWSIEIFLLDENGQEVTANCFEKATYILHPSFEKNKQVVKKPPFRIEEKGWGEFEMSIVLTGMHKGGEHTLEHDLNFQSERYEATHTITFRNPKPDLVALLAQSGPTGDSNGVRGKGDAAKKKGRSRDKNVDMEKLADGLQKLGEDDLLQVVTMVHDNKSTETYTKNDVESKLLTAHYEETCVLTCYRWRIPCRPLHTAGLAGQDAVGVHCFQD